MAGIAEDVEELVVAGSQSLTEAHSMLSGLHRAARRGSLVPRTPDAMKVQIRKRTTYAQLLKQSLRSTSNSSNSTGGKGLPSATLRFGYFDAMRVRMMLFASVQLSGKSVGTLSLWTAGASAPASSFPAFREWDGIHWRFREQPESSRA